MFSEKAAEEAEGRRKEYESEECKTKKELGP